MCDKWFSIVDNYVARILDLLSFLKTALVKESKKYYVFDTKQYDAIMTVIYEVESLMEHLSGWAQEK